MATKKTKKVESGEPIVTVGSHSVRTEYPNGKVDFVVDDVKLKADVLAALAEFAATKETPKKTRTKKVKE